MSIIRNYLLLVSILWIVYTIKTGFEVMYTIKADMDSEHKHFVIKNVIQEKSIENLFKSFCAPILFIFELLPHIIIQINNL